MKDLVKAQLALSVQTLQAVLDDEAIHETMLRIGELTADAMRSGRKLLIAGNGGSAADAQHLAAEFVMRLTVDRPAMRAVALTTDTSTMTAIGNDWGYEHVFARQVEALAQAGDVLLAISTSGNSKNLVMALELARQMGLVTIGFTGSGGGKMLTLCDYNVVIPSGATAKIQEAHLALEHIFCMLVERFTFGVDFDKAPQKLSE